MAVSEIVRLTEGQHAGLEGLSFTFHSSIPDLLASTTAEGGRFTWQWLLVGNAVEKRGARMTEAQAGLLVGNLGERVHLIVLPMDGSAPSYQVSGRGAMGADVRRLEFKTGLLRRRKDTGVLLAWSDQRAFKAFAGSTLDAHGQATDVALQDFVGWLSILLS